MTMQTIVCSKCGLHQSDLNDNGEILLVDEN